MMLCRVIISIYAICIFMGIYNSLLQFPNNNQRKKEWVLCLQNYLFADKCTVFNEHNGLVEVENILFAANVFKAKERVFKLLNFAVKLQREIQFGMV